MSKGLSFNKKEYNKPEEAGLPQYPDTCGIPKCTNETDFVMIKVSSGRGIEHRVASDVLVSTSKPYKLKDGYNYIGWFTRCGRCLMKGIEKNTSIQKIAGEL